MGEVRWLERNVFPLVFGNIELTPAQSPSWSEMVNGGQLCQYLGRRTLHMVSLIYICRKEQITH